MNDQVVVITGAGSGLARSAATYLATPMTDSTRVLYFSSGTPNRRLLAALLDPILDPLAEDISGWAQDQRKQLTNVTKDRSDRLIMTRPNGFFLDRLPPDARPTVLETCQSGGTIWTKIDHRGCVGWVTEAPIDGE